MGYVKISFDFNKVSQDDIESGMSHQEADIEVRDLPLSVAVQVLSNGFIEIGERFLATHPKDCHECPAYAYTVAALEGLIQAKQAGREQVVKKRSNKFNN